MLYDIWRDVARARGAETALVEAATGGRWSFGALARLGEGRPRDPGPLAHPRGQGVEFVVEVLRAWHSRMPVCPLENDQAPPICPPPPPGCDQLKLTSGTTGRARLVALTGAQMAADAANIVATMRLRPDWPNLGAVSLAHSYGFSNLVLPLLLHGIPLILAPAPLPAMVRAAAEGWPALTLAGVPALWAAWHRADAIPAATRLAISAGAPLGLEIEREIHETRGLKVHNFYGSSECGGIAYDDTELPRPGAAIAGRPMDNVALTVDETGCLVVRSAAVGETYWPEPEPALGGGSFRTSDRAVLEGGVVRLAGRLGDAINVAGRKVAPEAIERVLAAHPAVRQCLVFSAPSEDSSRAEEVIAAVVAWGSVSSGDLRAFLLARLPAWQVPRAWWFVEAIEPNARGKISRSEWRAAFVGRHGNRGPTAW